MEWFERLASMWAGPNGEREISQGSHGDKGYSILVKLKMAETMGKKPTVVDGPSGPSVEDKGNSGEEAHRLAIEELYNEGIYAYSPKVHVRLFELGWVLINDENRKVPMVMGKSRSDVVRAEEAIMQYLSKGPLFVVFEGAGAGFEMSMEDVESTGSFDQALTAAQDRAGAGARGSLGDLGIWSSNKMPKVNFDKP